MCAWEGMGNVSVYIYVCVYRHNLIHTHILLQGAKVLPVGVVDIVNVNPSGFVRLHGTQPHTWCCSFSQRCIAYRFVKWNTSLILYYYCLICSLIVHFKSSSQGQNKCLTKKGHIIKIPKSERKTWDKQNQTNRAATGPVPKQAWIQKKVENTHCLMCYLKFWKILTALTKQTIRLIISNCYNETRSLVIVQIMTIVSQEKRWKKCEVVLLQ